jgi:hypothetical protein
LLRAAQVWTKAARTNGTAISQTKAQDQQGQGDKVHRQQGAHEPQFAKRPTERRDRHLQEGDEQHHGQRRIDRSFQHNRARDQEADDGRDEHGGEVDPDLSRFQGVAKIRRIHSRTRPAALRGWSPTAERLRPFPCSRKRRPRCSRNSTQTRPLLLRTQGLNAQAG